MNMLRLSTILGGVDEFSDGGTHDARSREFRSRAARCVQCFEDRLSRRTAMTLPKLCAAASALWGPVPIVRIVIVGKAGSVAMEEMIRAAHRNPRPYKVVIPIDPYDSACAARLQRINPDIAALAMSMQGPGGREVVAHVDEGPCPGETSGRGTKLLRSPEQLVSEINSHDAS